MNSIDEKPKRYSRPFYTRPSCLGAMVLVFLACFGATTITISRNEDVKGTWVADFCRIVSVVLNRPKDACSDSSTGSNGDLTLVALQATQTKLAQPVSSTTPLPTIDTSASQTLQAIQATQTAMSIRPTATQTTDTSVTQTLLAIGATQTAMQKPTINPQMVASHMAIALGPTVTPPSINPIINFGTYDPTLHLVVNSGHCVQNYYGYCAVPIQVSWFAQNKPSTGSLYTIAYACDNPQDPFDCYWFAGNPVKAPFNQKTINDAYFWKYDESTLITAFLCVSENSNFTIDGFNKNRTTLPITCEYWSDAVQLTTSH